MSLPEFNIPINETEFNRRMKEFDAAIMKCSRKNYEFAIPPSLNILWLSTDMSNPNQAKYRGIIQKFLDVNGYDVEFTQTDVQITMQNEIDLLVINTDNRDNAAYLVRAISLGFLGLVPRHEVLVSGIGRAGESPYRGHPHYHMVVGTDFLVSTICLIHGYIRAYKDPFVISGRIISMMLWLEDKLLQSGIVKDGKADYASGKIKAFLDLLKCRRHSSIEVEWVSAVLELLRHIRNAHTHVPYPPSIIVKSHNKIIKINNLSKKYNRKFELSLTPNNQDTFIFYKRWLTRLTQVALHWIDEYLEKYPVQAKDLVNQFEGRAELALVDQCTKKPTRNKDAAQVPSDVHETKTAHSQADGSAESDV